MIEVNTKYAITSKYDAKNKKVKKFETKGIVLGFALLAGSLAYQLGQDWAAAVAKRIPVVEQYITERNDLKFLRSRADYWENNAGFPVYNGSNYVSEVQAKLDLVRAADSERKSRLQETISVGEKRLTSLKESHPSEIEKYLQTENTNSLWGFGLGGLVLVLTGMSGQIKRDNNNREKQEELAKAEEGILINDAANNGGMSK